MALGPSVRDLNTQISLIRLSRPTVVPLSRPTVHAADCHDRALVFCSIRVAPGEMEGQTWICEFCIE